MVLGFIEGALRLAYGPPSPTRLLRKYWAGHGEAFRVANGSVTTLYQGMDAIPPFPASPAPSVVRIMGFGESTMRGGSGIAMMLEFPGLLETALRNDGYKVEAVNLARPGMDSHSIPIIVSDALAFKPAIAMFYMGHNDIGNGTLEARYSDITNAAQARIEVALEHFQLYAQLRRIMMRNASLPQRQPAMSPAQRMVAVEEFRENLQGIVRTCQRAGVRPILITPASPLDGWFPGGATCSNVVPNGTWQVIRGHWVLRADLLTVAQMEQAWAMAPQCPDALYLHGMALLRQGQRDLAWQTLSDARDHEPFSLRASSGIDDAVRAVAADTGAKLVDWEAWLRTRDEQISLFNDNVHLTARGHELLAELAFPTVEEEVKAVAH